MVRCDDQRAMTESSVEAGLEWTPPNRRRWREQDGRQMLKALVRSGETAVRFARRHGLQPQRVYAWQRRCAAEAIAERSFAPVHLEPFTSPTSGSALELVLRGGQRVRVGRGFDPALLRRVVAAIESERCPGP